MYDTNRKQGQDGCKSALLHFLVPPSRCTVCPRSSGPLYIGSYYINWVTTSWTYSMYCAKTLTALDSLVCELVHCSDTTADSTVNRVARSLLGLTANSKV